MRGLIVGWGVITRRVAVLLTSVLVVTPAHAQHYLHASDVDALPSRPADQRVSYGPDSLEFGDLRLPSGAARPPYPVVAIIHGGCWVARYATLQNTAALADALTQAGVATWNIEYRRADRPGGGWPGTFLDAGRAVDFLRTLASRAPLDTTRVVVMGHSAGGHLALWVAARHRLPASSPLHSAEAPLAVRGVVDLAGPPDLASFYAPDTAACGEGVAELLGATPDRVPDRVHDGSPSVLVPLGVPQAWLSGVDDRIVPSATQLAPFADAARQAGDRVTLTVIPRASHFELITPTSSAYAQVRAAVLALLGPAIGSP
jgi:acetyl esterase/lipase